MPIILVVDDSPTAVKLITGTLSDAGFEVHSACDGEQALRAAAEFRPDIVVLDIILPKQNGYEVCRRLKQNELTSHARIVLLTSKSHAADRQWGLRQGADAYLTKPVGPEQLLECIDHLLHAPTTPN
jgi:twitching motility two-component system response regulator PilH